jgi:thiol-disulfide isomerase/thioredoxin
MAKATRKHFTLFFIHGGKDEATGEHLCEACKEAAPMVEAYAKRHPEVKVEEVDLAVVDWKAKKWAPRLTPTLVVLKPEGARGAPWVYYEGVPSEAEFVAWISYHIPYGV